MGYYMAGDVADPMGLYKTAAAASADNSTPPSDSAPKRHKTRVINLTALSRAERRIERATKVAARLFTMKRSGVHGLKAKRHHRKKKGF